MRVPLSWLGSLVPLPDDVEALAHRLTLAGLEVTSIEQVGGDWQGVVVGRVLEVAKHPDADRLRLVTVDRGGGEQQTVVCGAPNVAEGQDIAFACEGAVLTDPQGGKPRVLKKSKIRGVVSAGMVCSEAELGLSEEHAGILVLETDRAPGTPLRDVLGDRVFVFDLTPNRADALSVVGVAREVAALTGVPLTEPDTQVNRSAPGAADRASVEIEDPELCQRFTLALIEDVEVGPSPDWMRERLTAAGMRSINNLVDITNYVMLETGQPVHAFDFDKVREQRIIVRRAKSGETLTTLDGKPRKLDPERLVIADPSGPIALAGVMGGLETEITDQTRHVLLEVANFDPASVRRTARAFDLFSDAARRFAWGLPPELAPIASARVCRLLSRYAGGRVAAGTIIAGKQPESAPRIRLRRSRIEQVLGMEVSHTDIRAALTGLGFELGETEQALTVTAPWWRRDVQSADDLVEEVARVSGYDDLPTLPLSGAIPHHPQIPARDLRERVRDLAVEAGLNEVQTYSLVSQSDLVAVHAQGSEDESAPTLRIANPLGEGRDTLRTSLRPGILRAAAHNLDHGARDVCLFEVARCYHPPEANGDGAAAKTPREVEWASGLVAGERVDRFGNGTGEVLDFFDAKATLERVLDGLGVDATFRPAAVPGFVPGRSASVERAESDKSGQEEEKPNGSANTRLGTIGQLHPEVATAFGIEKEVFLWELELRLLLDAPAITGPVLAKSLPRHPSASEDFAFLVGEDVLADDLVREALSHPLVVEARVFDDYHFDEAKNETGDGDAAGKRSLGIAVRYQAPNRTLDERDIAKVRRTILKRLQANHGAVVRERS